MFNNENRSILKPIWYGWCLLYIVVMFMYKFYSDAIFVFLSVQVNPFKIPSV